MFVYWYIRPSGYHDHPWTNIVQGKVGICITDIIDKESKEINDIVVISKMMAEQVTVLFSEEYNNCEIFDEEETGNIVQDLCIWFSSETDLARVVDYLCDQRNMICRAQRVTDD